MPTITCHQATNHAGHVQRGDSRYPLDIRYATVARVDVGRVVPALIGVRVISVDPPVAAGCPPHAYNTTWVGSPEDGGWVTRCTKCQQLM